VELGAKLRSRDRNQSRIARQSAAPTRQTYVNCVALASLTLLTGFIRHI
jgi:hypothetical protein